MMKFSRAVSRVKWLSGEKTNVSKTISVLVTLRTRAEMVFETLVFSQQNHLTQLIARENFITNRIKFVDLTTLCITSYLDQFCRNRFSTAISPTKKLGSGTNGPAVCIAVCLT
jgi:hypothetical protein